MKVKFIQRAISEIERAGSAVEAITGEALENRAFAEVVVLAEMARQLNLVIELGHHEPPPSASREAAQPVALVPLSMSPTEQPSKDRPTKKRPTDYPRFVRQTDNLVKIGWSKSKKMEYQHKAPRSVLLALARALEAVDPPDSVFSADSLLPLRNVGGEEIPDYQSYLCLAFLRNRGIVEQHGRRGYSVVKSTTALLSNVSTLWNELERTK